MESKPLITFKKVQVNLVKQSNIKDAKYIVIDKLDDIKVKFIFSQAKNKFKQGKFQSIAFYKEAEQKPKMTLVLCADKDSNIKKGQQGQPQKEEEVKKDLIESIKSDQQILADEQHEKKVKFSIIAKETLVDEESMKQLYSASKLEGCLQAFGMPDLHPGKGIPIGASIITEGIIYPELVDYDIGCGMCFLKTGMQVSKLTQKRLEMLSFSLKSIDCPWTSDYKKYEEFLDSELQWGSQKCEKIGIDKLDKKTLQALGTIGGGNHFAEFQEVNQIIDQQACDELQIDQNEVFMLVHSGSRNLGEKILQGFLDDNKSSQSKGAIVGSEQFDKYMSNHDLALNFARRNRFLIAHRILEQIDSRKTVDKDIDSKYAIGSGECIVDIFHNFVEKSSIDNEDGTQKEVWIHRKGATPSTHSKYLVIPGSRGSYSYLVKVCQENVASSGYSLAHGAGRRMNRSKALAINKNKHPNHNDLLKTEFDSLVVCENKQLVYEEAPIAYKNIDSVVRDLVEFGLVTIVAQLKPLLTYKFKEPEFQQLQHRYDPELHRRKEYKKQDQYDSDNN
ncbi:release factor h-coupled family protein [Stylonychia lemnae]|uniref:3'-phosphate/5'-hydroxy nucleic acid ligase n=1 Tax=Stylonychia lemnae TaxID=5949 RepID=A0A078AND2_STYLE|nr:release factor h-coupled family protein [Stylonychia lemnae]|eukprot:CDW83679.1 release factor h-coupled family protein [Stylonychia lemnae]